MSLTASTTMSVATLPIVRAGDQCRTHFKPIVSVPAGPLPLGMQSQLINNRRRLRYPVQEKRASILCAAALNARCAEGQTQTVTRESSTNYSCTSSSCFHLCCSDSPKYCFTRVGSNMHMSTFLKSPEQHRFHCYTSGKEKSPDLDDGGTGFPPRDDDGGGGGGGGGGGHWKGGFFFFGFLAFLGLLKDQEEEGPYRDQRRR